MPVERNIHDVDTLFLALEISCYAGGASLNLHFEQYRQRTLAFFLKKNNYCGCHLIRKHGGPLTFSKLKRSLLDSRIRGKYWPYKLR